jgi:hypothetical protein
MAERGLTPLGEALAIGEAGVPAGRAAASGRAMGDARPATGREATGVFREGVPGASMAKRGEGAGGGNRK